MAWWKMVASGLVALSALMLYPHSSAITGVSATGLLQRLYAGPVSQLVFGGEDGSLNATNSGTAGKWDISYHLGGNSPWIPKTQGTVEGGIDPPAGCRVDQVHMMSRHAERYPTTLSGIRMLELYQHIQKANVTLKSDLAFANDWDFFMRDPSGRLENLVSTGPNAGTLEAFNTGVKLRTRYEDLLEEALVRNQTSFWASGSKRVAETAGYFGAGFYGIHWNDAAQLHIIPETEDRGGDTLTPGKSCFKYLHNADRYGRAYGYRMWHRWRETYLPAIVERLAEQNRGIAFSESEIYSMQELCGFETIAKGSSEWCDVFTHEEWERFEYARDVLHYYRTGPGNPYSATMSWLWLNATANLLREGPAAGALFFSFVHDGDIIPMLSALKLLPQQQPDLPTTHLSRNRNFRTSDIVPMGGRIIFERLACGAPQGCYDKAEYGYPNMVYCDLATGENYFVRINVNDGVVALPGCDDGPGRSCPLEEFLERVEKRGREIGDFREVCGLPKDAEAGISFLHQ